jgi:hypothetical protein
LAPRGLVTFAISDENGKPSTTDRIDTLGCIYSDSCAKAGRTRYAVQPQQLANSTQYEAFVRLTAPFELERPTAAAVSRTARSRR